MTDLTHLIERCESGSGPDRELDALVCAAIRYVPRPRYQYISELRYEALDDGSIEAFLTTGDERKVERFPSLTLTSSLDAVLSLIEQKLPGFWWRGGTCYLSSEARVCPDHNCPTHGARLLVECPPTLAHWNEGIEVELRPGSQNALVRALLAAFLKAYANKEGVSDGR